MRSTTPDGYFNVYDDNDNPGAGSKTLTPAEGNTGLNGNFVQSGKLMSSHNPDGSHKNDIIHGANMHPDSVDGITLEYNTATGTKYARVKLGSLTLAYLSVSGAADGEVPVYSGGTLDWGKPVLGAANIEAGAITSEKIAHNNTRTKSYLVFAATISGGGNQYFECNGQVLSAALGVPMLRGGAISGWAITQSDGTVVLNDNSYSPSADNHFNQGDRLALYFRKIPGDVFAMKNGTPVTNIGSLSMGTFGATVGIIEIEFD